MPSVLMIGEGLSGLTVEGGEVGATDLGTGSDTVLAQIGVETLAVPLGFRGRIRLTPTGEE